MAVYTQEVSTQLTFPNITIYNLLEDGVHYSYKAVPNDGYVMYDTNDEAYEEDPDTGEQIPVIYYRLQAYLPLSYDFNNFSYVAVLRSTVDENYIFGGGDNNNHETV